MRKRKRKQQKKNRRKNIIWYSVFLIVVLTGIFIISGRDDSLVLTETKRNQIINSNEWKEIFEHSEDYPPVLLEDLKRNPEMLDFVKKYPGEQSVQDAGKLFRFHHLILKRHSFFFLDAHQPAASQRQNQNQITDQKDCLFHNATPIRSLISIVCNCQKIYCNNFI